MWKDEWLTPPEILTALGPFDLDPCSPVLRPWSTAARHYTKHDNGLSLPWSGRVFCNPPYGKQTGRWLARCAEHQNATALIFARTETADWVEYIWKKAHAVMFLWGRLHFYHADGTRAKANAGGPSALVSYNEDNTHALEHSGLRGRVINLYNVRMSDPEPAASPSKAANPKDSLDAPVGLSEGLENNPPRQRPNLMKTTTIEIKGRLTKAQCDTISAAAGWIERICNRKDELPKLFMDNTDPAPIAKKLRAMVKGAEATAPEQSNTEVTCSSPESEAATKEKP
jgi:hypothetical protein